MKGDTQLPVALGVLIGSRLKVTGQSQDSHRRKQITTSLPFGYISHSAGVELAAFSAVSNHILPPLYKIVLTSPSRNEPTSKIAYIHRRVKYNYLSVYSGCMGTPV